MAFNDVTDRPIQFPVDRRPRQLGMVREGDLVHVAVLFGDPETTEPEELGQIPLGELLRMLELTVEDCARALGEPIPTSGK